MREATVRVTLDLAMTVGTAFVVGWLCPPAHAQLSPGDLSRPHAELEGSGHCMSCHHKRRGVDPSRCLSCHVLLQQRIEAQEGLHARQEYRQCETCHIEHHGRDFDLVWWGEAGVHGFDHGLTGYVLQGAHTETGCRQCHRADLVAEKEKLVAAGKNLGRSFLGLDAACLSCHEDVHRQQFGGANCLSCHSMAGWRPAPLFDHDRTSFPLTGRHRRVACAQCHTSRPLRVEGRSVALVRYRGVATACVDCHRDPHAGRLGNRCQSCHSTAGWERVQRTGFDHDATRYPLRGLHRQVRCEECHTPGRSLRIAAFERCTTCHRDTHLGQFRARSDGGPCTSCHDVKGFVPARFGLEEHQNGPYPLEGAHLAVACVACHQTVTAAVIVRAGTASSRSEPRQVRQFRFTSTTCRDCHSDPHRGEVDKYLSLRGCQECHRLATWHAVTFDHGRTGYRLEGAHRGLACVRCHPPARATPAVLRMTGAPTSCRGCHDAEFMARHPPDGGGEGSSGEQKGGTSSE